MKSVSILGAGKLANALAINFAKNKVTSFLWEYSEDNIPAAKAMFSEFIDSDIRDKYIHYTSDIKDVISKSPYIIVALPSEFVVKTLNDFKLELKQKEVIIGSKGLGEGGNLFSDLIDLDNLSFLYGPSIASEMARGDLTGLVLSGKKPLSEFITLLQRENLRVSYTNDYIGCQLSATMKNVLLIYLGILEGIKVSENTYAYYFVHALEELVVVGEVLGGRRETFYSLSGLGDMMLNSRNKKFGIYFGEGLSVKEIFEKMQYEVEGYRNTKVMYDFIQKHNLECPILRQLYAILFEGLSLDSIHR